MFVVPFYFLFPLSYFRPATSAPPPPSSYWQVEPPIDYNDTLYAGWDQIEATKEILVYDGSAVNRTYAHHPALYAQGSNVYLIHSSAPIDEDSMGQDVWITVSHDGGFTWSAGSSIIPAAVLPNQTDTKNFTYWCQNQIWQRAFQALALVEAKGQVYAVAQSTDFYCWGSIGSGTKAAGRVARPVLLDGSPAGDPCWLTKNQDTDIQLFNETIYGTKYGMKYCEDENIINAILDEPATAPAWGDWLYDHNLYAADGVHYMQEQTHAVWFKDASHPGGGYWQRFWRDITATNNTMAVWVETTYNRAGADWYPKILEQYGSQIFQTNIPDAKTKQHLGTITSGDRYLVSNPRNNSQLVRQPLTIAMSRGASHSYRTIGVLRTNASADIVPDTRDYKNHGFSYPSAIQVGGNLLVAYSENKENVWVSVVDVKKLP
ncbi:hypothetical protein GQ53DRAFT_883370 [Thozetella sp. PMI_491]|nr:hypothetical protein GQ53DRAFT_883370 [Thozetella sp. PMI_491]